MTCGEKDNVMLRVMVRDGTEEMEGADVTVKYDGEEITEVSDVNGEALFEIPKALENSLCLRSSSSTPILYSPHSRRAV